MFLFSVLVQIPFMHSSEDTIGIMGGILCTVQTVLLIVSVIPTEIALKKTFFENERRL